ncbi:hypothetical protein ACIQT7_05865 [Agrobacterium deltaense]
MYDPRDWYWLADDGRLFSSALASLVEAADESFAEWKGKGFVPTPWPTDADGAQTSEVLQRVLAPYGLIVAESAIDAARTKKIDALTVACASAITGNYVSDALGAVHAYPSKQVDQLNMMGSVTDALTPGKPEDWKTPFWCANANGEWEFREHTASQIIAAGQAGKAHVVTCQTILAELSAQVAAAQTIGAVEAITWPSS